MKYLVDGSDLTSVANAIRTKGGTASGLSFPSGFVSAIGDISTGSSAVLVTKTITANGTYSAVSDSADGYSSVTVGVPGYSLLGSSDLTTSTTNTSSESAGTISNLSGLFTKGKIVLVRIRDKAGKRLGYFYGSDTFFMNTNDANGSTAKLEYGIRAIYSYTTDGTWQTVYANNASGYGVYGYEVHSDGKVALRKRYNAASSLTVDGTYACEVYLLDWPGGVSPFNATSV